MAPMLEDLDQLASRISELALHMQAVRADNQTLRADVAARDAEIVRLRGALTEAYTQVNQMLDRLPALEPVDAEETESDTDDLLDRSAHGTH
jgi:chromosome segregation ATPase